MNKAKLNNINNFFDCIGAVSAYMYITSVFLWGIDYSWCPLEVCTISQLLHECSNVLTGVKERGGWGEGICHELLCRCTCVGVGVSM